MNDSTTWSAQFKFTLVNRHQTLNHHQHLKNHMDDLQDIQKLLFETHERAEFLNITKSIQGKLTYKAGMKPIQGGREPASTARHFKRCRSHCCHGAPEPRLLPKPPECRFHKQKANKLPPQRSEIPPPILSLQYQNLDRDMNSVMLLRAKS
jgi:hypothetical protein